MERSGRIVGVTGLFACVAVVSLGCGGADRGEMMVMTSFPAGMSTGDDDDDDTTMGGGDSLDDTNATSSTSSTTAGFETLTTAATSGPPDPTNTSGDTNETGASEIDIAPDDLIDDLEDGDSVIYETGGRIGVWYAYDDATGGMSNPAAGEGFLPTPGGPNGSSYSAFIAGGGFTSWGAGMGFDLDNSGGPIKHPFNASGYTGIVFQARGDVSVAFKVQTSAVVPTSEGGTCNAGGSCNDAYATTVALGPTWQQFVVPFATLQQAGWGQAAAFDPASLLGLQWEVAAGSSFEVVVDDVGFY